MGDGRKSHALVLGTSVCFLALFLVGFYLSDTRSVEKFDTTGFPTLGSMSSPVQIVVFTDFRCKGCQWFHDYAFPEIFHSYIVPQKASLTLIPLSYIQGTRPAVNAAIWVHKEHPEYFFSYYDQLHELFKHSQTDPTEQNLIYCAQKVGLKNTNSLQECISQGMYDKEADEYFQFAKHVMNNHVATPTIYVNGKNCSLSSVDHILKTIEKEWKNKSKQ